MIDNQSIYIDWISFQENLIWDYANFDKILKLETIYTFM